MIWQLQEAKNKFSEVIEITLKEGPQIITRRNKNTAVLMSYEDYQRLIKLKQNLKHLLRNSGFYGLDVIRDKSVTGRASEQDII